MTKRKTGDYDFSYADAFDDMNKAMGLIIISAALAFLFAALIIGIKYKEYRLRQEQVQVEQVIDSTVEDTTRREGLKLFHPNMD